jgi:hypothetical protein
VGGPVGEGGGGGGGGDGGLGNSLAPPGPGGATAPPPEQLNAQALERLRALAPSPTEPKPPAGTRITTFLVKWEAVLVTKAPEGEAKNAGGGT